MTIEIKFTPPEGDGSSCFSMEQHNTYSRNEVVLFQRSLRLRNLYGDLTR